MWAGAMVLNADGPHWPTGSGFIESCSLIGLGVALWEDVCHWGAGFEVSGA